MGAQQRNGCIRSASVNNGESSTRSKRRQQKHTEQQQAAHQSVKKPETLAEALQILKLRPPVTTTEIKHAFRVLAQVAHPDHGGSHAAMVILNAAYELALASV